MAFRNQRGNGGGYSDRGDRRSSHPDDQRSTRGYGSRGNGGGGGRDGGRRSGWDPLWQHKVDPVQYGDNSFAVVSVYAMRPNDRFPESRAFVDIRDFFYAQQDNGGEFLCATSRGLKVPIERARELCLALQDAIAWVESVHPEVHTDDEFRKSVDPQRAPRQQDRPNNSDAFGDFDSSNAEPPSDEEVPF